MKALSKVLMGLGYDPLKLGEVMKFYLRATFLKPCFLNESCITMVLYTYLESPLGMSHVCIANLEGDTCLPVCYGR